MTWMTHLVDDAAVLAPGDAPLELAVKRHHEHVTSEVADLVGGFVVPDTALAELHALAAGPLDLVVVVTGGAGAIEPAVQWAGGDGLVLRRLRIALREGAGTGDDLARNAQRVAAMVAHCELEVPVHVAVPRVSDHSWRTALDEVAMSGLGLTFRADDDLAGCIDAALDRETTFEVLGGSVPDVLAAASTALHGSPDPEGWASTRRWLVAVSSPSVSDVHADLVERGLRGPT